MNNTKFIYDSSVPDIQKLQQSLDVEDVSRNINFLKEQAKPSYGLIIIWLLLLVPIFGAISYLSYSVFFSWINQILVKDKDWLVLFGSPVIFILTLLGLTLVFSLLKNIYLLINLTYFANKDEIFSQLIQNGKITKGQVLKIETQQNDKIISFYYMATHNKQQNIVGQYRTMNEVNIHPDDNVMVLHWNFIRILL